MELPNNVKKELIEKTMEISYIIDMHKTGWIPGHDNPERDEKDVIDFTDSVICKNNNGGWEYFWRCKVDSKFVTGDVKIRSRNKLNCVK